MRIGIDCRLYSTQFTGIGRYVHELVNHFISFNDEEKRKHEFVLFFNNPEFEKFNPPNLSIKKVLVDSPHYSFAEQTKFPKILNSHRLDVVHFPHFNVPIFYRRPYIVTIHDLTLSLFPGSKMTKLHHRLAYNMTIKNAVRKAKKVISISENTKKDIIEYLKICEDKIETIYNGVSRGFQIVPPEESEKTLKKYGIEGEFMLYTGVWRSHKNLPRMIRAFKLLHDRSVNIKLVITGRPDPHYPEIKETVKDLNLEESVVFTGMVSEDELVHLYNAARIYLFPSLYEGFGLPPLESMLCGTPVAASSSSSIPEICGEGNAVFFDPYDIYDMANKIEVLYRDANLQAELVENGLRRALSFSWEKCAKKTWRILTGK